MKIVQKYGGSSLADEECLYRVAKRIAADAIGNQMLVVVSAQGKTTDALTNKYNAVSSKFPSRESDALLITGEQASAALLSAALCEFGSPAISLNGAQVPIVAEGFDGDGRIQKIGASRIHKEWECGNIVVVTGFQGVKQNGDMMTLGRGGSDTTAVAIAAALKADRCMIFTDVDGVYSADPRKEGNAKCFNELHCESMLHLATAGAKVLHPRAAELALQYNVPVSVLSSFSQREGTAISPLSPKQTGVTVCTDGSKSAVTAVLAEAPTVPQLMAIEKFGKTRFSDFFFGASILRATVAPEMADETLKFLHKIFCEE